MLYCDSPTSGGFESLVARLADTLAQTAFDVELLYWDEKLAGLVTDPRVRKTRLGSPAGTPLPFLKAFAPASIRRLGAAFRLRRDALLVICQSSIEIGARALIAARLMRIPTVSYLAFAFDFRTLGLPFGMVRERVDDAFYRLPAQFIALSDFQGTLIRERVSVPVHVIPMVVPADIALAPRQRTEGAALEIGVVGAVSFRIKGQDVLPGLAGALLRAGRPFRIHVIGDGPDLGDLRARVAMQSLAGYFTFHGAIPYGAPAEKMRAMDVLVIPSTTEGAVPLVAFEALAAGTPFVITHLAATRDWMIPDELQFDRTSSLDIIRAIDAALTFRGSPRFQPFQRRMLDSVSESAFATAVRDVFEALATTPGSA